MYTHFLVSFRRYIIDVCVCACLCVFMFLIAMRIWLISSYIYQNSRIIKKVSQLKYVYILFRGYDLNCITRELEKVLTPILRPCPPKWVCHFNHRITVRGTAERFWIQLWYPSSNGIEGWDIWHDSGNKVYEWWGEIFHEH